VPVAVNTSIDGYTVREFLGGGSYGDVYKVTDSDGNTHALKLLKENAPPEGRSRLLNEAWALEQLDHPSLPKLSARGEYNGLPYIVMTLAHGKSLRHQVIENRNDGGAFPFVRVLSIITAVLKALRHMHEKEILHRDVKDDNILVTPSGSEITLIDLGFCKGISQPEDPGTFWNAGAARYSPPSKLIYPSRALAAHDVFAVGVVAYLLLTNHYPWDGDTAEDVGTMRERMQARPPEQISKLNSLVPEEVSDSIMRLLEIEDDKRPTVKEALDDIERLTKTLGGRRKTLDEEPAQLKRVIRDNLHGDIRMTEFEWEIINTPEFQRLRWIKQLGLTNLVYPGAEHTRFSHSIGACHLADRILKSVQETSGVEISTEKRLLGRCYALLHDIVHVPYGHTLEDELGIFRRHDANSARIDRLLFAKDSVLGDLLRSRDIGRAVLARFDPATTDQSAAYLEQLMEGPVGADVLDYIDRDALHCGLDHRVDTAIYRRFRITQPRSLRAETGQTARLVASLHGRHGLRIDAEFALETVFWARYALFLKVYTHPVKTAAGAMLGKSLAMALKAKKKQGLSERTIESSTDIGLLERLRSSSEGARELRCSVRTHSGTMSAPHFNTTTDDNRSKTRDSSIRNSGWRSNVYSPVTPAIRSIK
jgi:HD superfamily phosphohydrolase